MYGRVSVASWFDGMGQGLSALDFRIRSQKGSKRRFIAPSNLGGGYTTLYKVRPSRYWSLCTTNLCFSLKTESLSDPVRGSECFFNFPADSN